MIKPLNNTLSLEDDALYAAKLMQWQQELEREKKVQSAADAIFHPDAVRGRILECNLQIMHATEVSVLRLFTYNKEDRLCLPQ